MNDAPLQRGTRITPSLELVRPLGAGGMGTVWIARHHGLGSDVVVKFISPELAKSTEAIARFQREASAAAEVRSPHVVQTLDHGLTTAGIPYIAMELLEGESLRQRLDRERRLPPTEVVTIVSHCAKALSRAHDRGVVHRDIKPDNIFLTDGGDGEVFAKVLDFGIAKSSDTSLVATTTGAMLGSPYYMSPEQVRGSRAVDARTDLWALGVTALEAITGRRPFEAETIGALAIAICHDPLPAPSKVAPTLPASFDAWFAKACARDPSDRFSNAKELSDALARALAGTSRPEAPVDPIARTLPMSTTAGVGLHAEQATARRSRRVPIAIGALLVTVGAIVVAVVAVVAREPVAEPGAPTAKPEPAPAKAAPSLELPPAHEAATGELLPLDLVADASPSVAMTNVAAKNASSPKKLTAASVPTPPAPAKSTTSTTPKPPNDPNIF
ncbi:MAG: serine/threonine protein kinase [Deltaproteobacteria bacterium]|nr:serine/threonine protein kinase [Deltaproteobacteria bacterium]